MGHPAHRGFDPVRVRSRGNLPALLLIVTAAGGMAFSLCNSAGNVMQLLGVQSMDQFYAQLGMPAPSPQEQRMSAIMGLGISMMQLLTGSLIIVGAVQMRRLLNHGFAMVGAILAMMPCITPCCGCLTFPFGIWALVVLYDREVQYAFALNAQGQLPDGPPLY
jgi:hypothetical protein